MRPRAPWSSLSSSVAKTGSLTALIAAAGLLAPACKTTASRVADAGNNAGANNASSANSADPCAVDPMPQSQVADFANNFYQDDAILTANLAMDQADWDKMRLEAPPQACANNPDFKYSKFTATLNLNGYNAGEFELHKKSVCGSLSTTKPGMDLKKDKDDGSKYVFDKSLGSDKFRQLTFNNSVQDASYMRQCFSYQLIRDLGMPAPRCNYTKLCVNQKYIGMYINVEPVDQEFVAHFYNDTDASGLLLGGQWNGANTGRAADFYATDPTAVFKIRFTSEADLAAEFAKDTYTKFLAVVNKDPTTLTDQDVTDFGNFIDMPAFRKQFLIEHLLANGDGPLSNRNNYYFYMDPATRLWHIIPWGMDQTLKWIPNGPYTTMTIAKTYAKSTALAPTIAADYAALVAGLSEPERKAKVQAMAARIKPLLPANEQQGYDAAVENLTWTFWKMMTINPQTFFGR